MPLARVEGTELFYEDLGGDGPMALILHGGLGLDHTYMRPAFDRLHDRFRVVYYDHRANGRSGRPPIETVTMAQLADDAAALATELGADRFAAIGHSYGGFVAQELAIRHPDRVLALALLCTTPGQLGATEGPTPEEAPTPPPELAAAMASPLASDEDYGQMMGKLAPFYLHSLDPDELRALMSSTVFSVEAMLRGFMALSEWSAIDRLDQITCPTLIAAGRHDLFTSWPQSMRIARQMPHARLEIFEDSGHFPWLEEPNRFWPLLDAWLATPPSSGCAAR